MTHTLQDNLLTKLKDLDIKGEVANNDGSILSREIIMPIPEELLTSEYPDILKFVKVAGELSRKPELGLPVEQEKDTVPTPQGNLQMLVLVFKYSKDTDVKGVIELFKTS